MLIIAFKTMDEVSIMCGYHWIEQTSRVGVQAEETIILDEDVQITAEMQEYFDYVLTNLGINR